MSFFGKLKTGDFAGVAADAAALAKAGLSQAEERTRGVRTIAADQLSSVANTARSALKSKGAISEIDILQGADAFAAADFGIPDGNGGWRRATRDEAEDAAALILAAADEPDEGYEDEGRADA